MATYGHVVYGHMQKSCQARSLQGDARCMPECWRASCVDKNCAKRALDKKYANLSE